MIRAALVLACLATPSFADRIAATTECEPAGEELLYMCHFMLSRGGEPLRNAAFTVTPTMPSMPMAHNIPPVRAEEVCDEGGYHVYLRLDMHGDWALTLDFTAPRRDRVVVNQAFTAADGAAGHHRHRHSH